MNSFWCSLVILSVLFMSADGAADIAIKGHPHGDGAAYQLDDSDSTASDSLSQTDSHGDHCEHCCHGHSASMAAQLASITTPLIGCDHLARRAPHVSNFAQAPPTPPPNA